MRFTDRVYEVVRQIPHGSVRTYQEVARLSGNPRAARAVGQAMRRNRHSFLTHPGDPQAVPCHRVVAAGGRLGGFNRGSAAKQRLLSQEGWIIHRHMLVGRNGA